MGDESMTLEVMAKRKRRDPLALACGVWVEGLYETVWQWRLARIDPAALNGRAGTRLEMTKMTSNSHVKTIGRLSD